MQQMIAGVKKGDRIVTIGGIHGVVASVKESTVVVKVDDGTRIEFSKSAISSVSPVKAEEKTEEKAKPADDLKRKPKTSNLPDMPGLALGQAGIPHFSAFHASMKRLE